jgi:serine/threonine protein kinase
MTELELFEAALERSPTDRAPFLDEACAGNQPLHQRLEALLARHEKAASFLEAPAAEFHAAAGLNVTADQPRRERPGIIIVGRYKLLEQIGEGGMGTVWVAEQSAPVKRRVALKVIKPGMDSRQVLSRFEAERQALALMDHPNIAKVYDGGMTDEGRPFFVMEYVKGMPITEYCDHARLSIADRLKLFVPVCQAVQHAHHKGIIHRDLKPSNILICLYDGQPVPKVIDFGLAKAMHQPLTEHTLYTAHGLMVGTPLYMSPEQAELNNLDVDTRTDIYSLGVILYELLTGTTPLEKLQFKDAAFQEILRLIKEVEPQRPSLKISTSLSLPSIAAQRNLEPAQLSRTVRGDLDWIVMKSLEKERSRRYETATSLAHDIERFLDNEPVQARPPSTAYRLRKFTQRNKAAVTAGLLIAASLLLGTAISTWQAIRATAAERRSQANLHSLQQVARELATSETLTGDPERAEAAIRLAEAANVSKAWTEILRAQIDINEGRAQDAVTRLTPITAGTYQSGDDDTQLAALSLVARAHLQNGDGFKFTQHLRRAREFRHDAGPEAGLFRAATELWQDPATAIIALEAATKKRFYPASLLIRANARSFDARVKQDYGLVLQAQKDLEFAEMFAGNSPSVLKTKLRVHSYGHEVALMVGDSQAAESHLSEVESCVAQLEKLPTTVLNTNYIAGAYARLNRWDKVLDVERNTDWRRAYFIQYAAAHLYERVTDPREALARFEKLKAEESNPERLIALASFCADFADKRGALPGLFRRVVADNPDGIVLRCRALSILALLGNLVELRGEARKILDQFGEAPDHWGYVPAIHYLADDWDEQHALKEISSPGYQFNMPYCQSNLQYAMGLECIACGDRGGAHQHFEACLQIPSLESPSRAWAQAYLARMDRDPNWPDWIKKQQ